MCDYHPLPGSAEGMSLGVEDDLIETGDAICPAGLSNGFKER